MLMKKMRAVQEACWNNPGRKPFAEAIANCPITMAQVQDASDRLNRFAGYFRVAFPETQPLDGIVESPLRQIPAMQTVLEQEQGIRIPGKIYLKMDSHLPISGSIKARGGIYEVLYIAEKIALEQGLLKETDDYAVFNTPQMRQMLSGYSIAVGSTGNLGLSIGIMSASLGFRVTVHMSADARQWKKDLLRSKGVQVIEYASDYSEAVRQGRAQAAQDPKCHFIDDENSQTLFLGYAVAALRVKRQLAEAGVQVDADHPLQVYLPCGVGGGPGGVAFGLKLMYGDAVQCFFAEPVNACCMMLGMSTGKHSDICVADIGISGQTAADGLAVGRASGFVGKLMEPFLAGCYTLSDNRMYRMLRQLADSEGIFLEPSALAGMYGPVLVQKDEAFSAYQDRGSTTHLVWATGGSLVPKEEMEKYYCLGTQA